MMEFIINLLVISIAIEAISEVITSSEITRPLREAFKRFTYPVDSPPSDTIVQTLKVWFDKLISCGYCVSVWVAGIVVFFSRLDFWFGGEFIGLVITTFAAHRIANLYHVLYELLRKGRIGTYDIELKYKEEDHGDDGEGPFEGDAETKPRIFETGRN